MTCQTFEPVPGRRMGSGTIQSWCWYHQEQTVHEAVLGQKWGNRGTLGHSSHVGLAQLATLTLHAISRW